MRFLGEAEGDGMAMGSVAERSWGSELGTARRQAPAWTTIPLTAPAAALVLFNLLDGFFTLCFLQAGVAEELNPLMRWAYEADPVVFMTLKFACVHAGIFVLALHREIAAARWVMRGAVAVYACLVTYHLGFLAHLLLR